VATPPQEPRIAVRLFGVAVLAMLVVASGQALSRAGARRATPAPPGAPDTGAWFCPHGGGQDWKGWLTVANPGSGPIRVRVTTFASDAAPAVRSFSVAARTDVVRELDVADPAAATEVEYFGGWVAAGTVVQSSGSGQDAAAERCVAGLGHGWLLPDATTATDSHTALVVVNPFDTLAEFNVVIRTNKRKIAPGDLSPVVLQPRRSTSIDVEKWALEGQGEDTITAQVVPKVGRVVAGSLVTSPQGVRAEAGIAAQSTRWLIPSAGYGAAASLIVMNLGPTPAVLTATAQGPGGPALLPDVDGKDLEPGTVQTFDVGQVANAGFVIGTSDGGTMAAALRVDGPKGGLATIAGTPNAGKGWIVLPTLPASGGTARLVLENLGKAPASVTVTLLGPKGPVAAPPGLASVTVPAHSTVSVFLPTSDVPLCAMVVATQGSIVAGGSSQSIGGDAFAATTGVPMP
jgi:hypothetical protein